MTQDMALAKPSSSKAAFFWFEVLSVLVVLSFFLLKGPMEGNEVDVLPLAKQYANPGWIPTDWYLNQPPGYRMLFQALAGRLISNVGFLLSSIIGRLFCYGLVAIGIVSIGRMLRLSLPLLLLATSLFCYPRDYRAFITQFLLGDHVNTKFLVAIIVTAGLAWIVALLIRKAPKVHLSSPLILINAGLFLAANNGGQGLAASESLGLGLEAKALAYGWVIIAIALLLSKRHRSMALSLGIATSFHVLVGGYAFLSAVGSLFLNPRPNRPNFRAFGLIGLLYVIGSSFAIKPVLDQLLTSSPKTEPSYSYIYVFLRLPHHLNPMSWHPHWRITVLAYLLILLISVYILHLQNSTDELSDSHPLQSHNQAAFKLCQFTLLSFIPFVLGLLAAPFDAKGSILQYYPFRLADVILPFSSCILWITTIDRNTKLKWRKFILVSICILLLSWSFKLRTEDLKHQVFALRQFPTTNSQLKDMYAWVRTNTPLDAKFLTSPGEFNNFNWLTERATIAKLKFLPQNKSAIIEWNERLTYLNGGVPAWPKSTEQNLRIWPDVAQTMADNYGRLTTEQVRLLMQKYDAQYMLTHADHKLNFPVLYENNEYILYVDGKQ